MIITTITNTDNITVTFSIMMDISIAIDINIVSCLWVMLAGFMTGLLCLWNSGLVGTLGRRSNIWEIFGLGFRALDCSHSRREQEPPPQGPDQQVTLLSGQLGEQTS